MQKSFMVIIRKPHKEYYTVVTAATREDAKEKGVRRLGRTNKDALKDATVIVTVLAGSLDETAHYRGC